MPCLVAVEVRHLRACQTPQNGRGQTGEECIIVGGGAWFHRLSQRPGNTSCTSGLPRSGPSRPGFAPARTLLEAFVGVLFSPPSTGTCATGTSRANAHLDIHGSLHGCNLLWWAHRAKAPKAVERPCTSFSCLTTNIKVSACLPALWDEAGNICASMLSYSMYVLTDCLRSWDATTGRRAPVVR